MSARKNLSLKRPVRTTYPGYKGLRVPSNLCLRKHPDHETTHTQFENNLVCYIHKRREELSREGTHLDQARFHCSPYPMLAC